MQEVLKFDKVWSNITHFGTNMFSILLSLYDFYLYGLLLLCTLLLIFLMDKSLNKLWYRDTQSTDKIPPGIRGLPLIGETIQFMTAVNSRNGFYEFVRTRHFRHGNCFKTNVFGETHVFVSSTESARAILNNESGNFTKKYIRSIGAVVGDQSLLCASHQHHKMLRNRLLNLFSTSSISLFVKQFDELMVKDLVTWKDGTTVNVLDRALKITFKAICKTLMNIENEKELEMLQDDISHVCEAMLSFPLRLPWTRFYKGHKARQRIMRRLDAMIAKRRRCNPKLANQFDFLQHLLSENELSSSPSSTKLTDAEIRDNILTMIIAGQDTTASAITWMVKYISENQNVLDKLRSEQLQISEITSSTCPFQSLEDLNAMPYASKVVKESLRLASIVPWLPRLALQDCKIEGFKVKKGWNVNVNAKSMHLDPNLYNEPNEFNPSRFDEEDPRPYSFLAFGMGGRTCLGINMARAMMLVFLHRLIITFKWEVTDSDPSIEKWAMFARLKSGCPIHVTHIRKDDNLV